MKEQKNNRPEHDGDDDDTAPPAKRRFKHRHDAVSVGSRSESDADMECGDMEAAHHEEGRDIGHTPIHSPELHEADPTQEWRDGDAECFWASTQDRQEAAAIAIRAAKSEITNMDDARVKLEEVKDEVLCAEVVGAPARSKSRTPPRPSPFPAAALPGAGADKESKGLENDRSELDRAAAVAVAAAEEIARARESASRPSPHVGGGQVRRPGARRRDGLRCVQGVGTR